MMQFAVPFTRDCLNYRGIWMKQSNFNLTLSSLPHTWILDVDGTICIHNGYKNGEDVLLDGVKDFLNRFRPRI